MSDFYIGYLPQAPEPLRHFVRKLVRGLLIIVAILALVLVKAQKPFAASAFEFQQEREFEGAIEERPYPALLVSRPAQTAVSPAASRYLLVAPGKHGADDIARGLTGQHVRLKGKLIYREEGTMIEVMPGSVRRQSGHVTLAEEVVDLGPAKLTGEIVDTKCYLGVMNPGSGKVHRECAARCLSGGIPPAFLVASSTSAPRLYELTSSQGGPIPRSVLLAAVGERITLQGRVVTIGSSTQFRVDLRLLSAARD